MNIPKEGQPGKTRPLGIPTYSRSRGANGCGGRLGADLRGRPAARAIRVSSGAQRARTPSGRSQDLLRTGFTEVVDADLSGYFDSIPHAELMKSVLETDQRPAHATPDQDVARSAGGRRRDKRGRKERTTRNKDEGKGTPQGSPISPCCQTSTCGDLFWAGRREATRNVCRPNRQLRGRLRDLLSRHGADEAMADDASDDVEAEADGERDEDATVPCSRKSTFDFLGYTFGRCYIIARERPTWRPRLRRRRSPSFATRSAKQTDRKVDSSGRGRDGRPTQPETAGWANYFGLGTVSRAYRRGELPRDVSAPSVALSEAQGAGVGDIHGTQTVTCTRSWACSSSTVPPEFSAALRGRSA